MALRRTAMSRLRLRTQLFLATLVTICAMTGGLLLIIRHTVSVETYRQVRDGTEDSIRAFEGVQHQRERQLSSSAAMIAEIPLLKSLMTTGHAPTIQDGFDVVLETRGQRSVSFSPKPDGEVVTLHVTDPGFPPEAAERDLKRSMSSRRYRFLVVRQRPPLLGFSSSHHCGRGPGIARTRRSCDWLSGERQRRAAVGARRAKSDRACHRSRRHRIHVAAKRRSDARGN